MRRARGKSLPASDLILPITRSNSHARSTRKSCRRGEGVWSALAWLVVIGAMTMRFLSRMLPMFIGLNSFIGPRLSGYFYCPAHSIYS